MSGDAGPIDLIHESLRLPVAWEHLASGHPKRAIEIRVFCCMSADDSAVVIFNTYDKGGDPSDKRQEREIDRAFKLLNEYRIAEARAKKAAARGRSA